MNKKIKYFAIIPLYGTCILLIHLFALSVKDKISKKNFFKIFMICAFVSAVCWYMVMMIIYVISKEIIYFDFNGFEIILTMIIAGYMINVFAFIYIDKNWNYLSYDNVHEKEKTFLEANKKKIILIALVVAIVITILALATILALGLI